MRLDPAVRVLLLSVTLSLAASTASAQTADCQSVRRTRILARASGLDGPNLLALERAACGGPLDPRGLPAFERPSRDCVRMTIMHALAAMVASDDVAQIDGTRAAVCEAGNLGELDEWPNGRRIRSGTAWVYPSGARFGSVGGALLYPNGETARNGDGAWRYPNGRTVDPDSRRFHLPDGRVVDSERELLAWICTQVGARRCEAVLDELPAAWADARGALITMLAWEAQFAD